MIRLEMPKNRSKPVKNGHQLHFWALNHRLADVLQLTWIFQLISMVSISCTKKFTHLDIKYGLNKVKIESEWVNSDLLCNCAFFFVIFFCHKHTTLKANFWSICPSIRQCRERLCYLMLLHRYKTLRPTVNKTEYTYYLKYLF